MTTSRILRIGTIVAVATVLMSGCAGASAAPTDLGPADEVRLGYFANVTHGPALVGLDQGFLSDSLGDTELTTELFSAGPAAIEALSAGAIDAAFIGPSPAINSFIKSGGESAVIVAGATSNGASLVVRDGIDSADDLAGTTLASPQLGNTQDVALRAWLSDQGFETSTTGQGDVTVQPTENADTLALFQSGRIDGAWLPEPWASRLVLEAGASALVDESSLWADGVFPTTVLLVNKDFLAEHPESVAALVEADVTAVDWIAGHPDDAAVAINSRIAADTGKPLADDVLTRALEQVEFSVDPAASTFPTLLAHAVDARIGADGDLDGLFDLRLLNQVLDGRGEAPVSAAGLGEE